VDRRQRAEPRKYIRAANIPGMDDGIAAGKRRERLRPQQAMSIGNRANGSHHARSAYKMSRVQPGAPVRTLQRNSCRQGWGRRPADGHCWRRGPEFGEKPRARHRTARVHHVPRRAPIFVYLLSRTFFPMAVRTYSSCSLLSVCRSTNPLLASRSIGRRSLSPLN
jgi:hypothetical protein